MTQSLLFSEPAVCAAAPSAATDAPRRILIHAINFAPEMIGCGKYTTELAHFLGRRGHRVEVVTAPPHYPGWRVRRPYRALAYAREVLDGIRVTRCPMLLRADASGLWRLAAPMSFALAAAPMVAWRIFRFRPEVVMCVEPTLFSVPAALLAAKLVGARSVLHVQDLEVDAAFGVGHVKGRTLRQLATLCERALLRRFDRLVTISEKMRATLLAKCAGEAKVDLLRNWVDLELICPQPRTGNAFRRELGLDEAAFVVLYAGHLGVKQALDVVVAAARRLKDRADIRFVIAGAGPSRARLQQASADLGNVLYLPMQPAERVNELLALADLHVLPQRKDTADLVLPSKLGGMLASGRPIVVTADPGTELFNLLANIALFAPAGDDAALADAVLLAKDCDLAERVERGLRLVETMSSARVLPCFERALLEPAA